jgi:hypothetical protein
MVFLAVRKSPISVRREGSYVCLSATDVANLVPSTASSEKRWRLPSTHRGQTAKRRISNHGQQRFAVPCDGPSTWLACELAGSALSLGGNDL